MLGNGQVVRFKISQNFEIREIESRDTPNDFKNSSEYILNHFERFRKVLIVSDVFIQNFKTLRKYIMKN